MVSSTSRFPIVIVIADEMDADPAFVQDAWHGVVKRFERAPGAVEEIGTTGMQLAPRRHTGHRADIAVVERCAPIREALKIGGMGPATTIRRKHVPVERIEHYHDCFHNSSMMTIG